MIEVRGPGEGQVQWPEAAGVARAPEGRGRGADDDGVVTSTAALCAVVAALSQIDDRVQDAERVSQLRALEEIKNACSAAQARITVEFDASQRADRAAAGRVSEWRATLIARTAVTLVDPAQRAAFDEMMAALAEGLSDRQVDETSRAAAYEMDPESAMRRARTAISDRRVSMRPAPDVMARLTGFVPAAQGVAAWKALDEHARSLKAAGDPRSVDQIKADTFIERLTGQESADAIGVEVGLVMGEAEFFGQGERTARLEGYGPIPAGMGRDLVDPGQHAEGGEREVQSGPDQHVEGNEGDVREAADGQAECDEHDGRPDAELDEHDSGSSSSGGRRSDDIARTWLRRLFTDPVDQTVAHVDTKRRRFDGPLRELISHRDQLCRTPWCGAPIRHGDHVRDFASGGPTTAGNGQGLCARCNLTVAEPGWAKAAVRPDAGGAPIVITTTPTGTRYASFAPPALYPSLLDRGGLRTWTYGSTSPPLRMPDRVPSSAAAASPTASDALSWCDSFPGGWVDPDEIDEETRQEAWGIARRFYAA